jgi:arylsulfatase
MTRDPSRCLLAGLAAAAWLAGCAEAPPNVLLISIDTLRADHLASYGYARDTAPHIGRLARAGVLWERAYAPAPATVASHATLFTGRLPYQHRTLNFGTPLPSDERTLAEILGEAGYRSFAIATSPRFHASSGFTQGFEHYELLDELPKDQRSRAVTDRALELATAGDGRPFFAFLHYFGPHSPYWPPEPWRGRWHEGLAPKLPGGAGAYVFTHRAPGQPVPGAVLDYLVDLYDGEISHLDSELARLFDGLEAQGLAENTLVVLVSDHGEEFKEHDGLSHARTLYEESLHVPLIMRWPRGLPRGVRVARPAQLADVVPTLLGLLGLAAPPGLPGRSLASDWEASPGGGGPDVVLGQRGVKQWSVSATLPEGRYKALFEQGRPPELYDLEADPGEQRDLAAGGAGTLARLVAAAPEPLVRGVEARPTQPVPEELRRRLAEIGYAEEVSEAPPSQAPEREARQGKEAGDGRPTRSEAQPSEVPEPEGGR